MILEYKKTLKNYIFFLYFDSYPTKNIFEASKLRHTTETTEIQIKCSVVQMKWLIIWIQ